MIAEKPDCRSRVYHVGLHRENLRRSSIDPCAPLETDGDRAAVDLVDEHPIVTPRALLETHDPRGLVVPGAAALALKVVSALQVWVKNQGQSGKSNGNDLFGKLPVGVGSIAIFLDAQIRRPHRVDFDKVVELAPLGENTKSHGAEAGVLQVFRGRKTLDILHEFLDALACNTHDVVELARRGRVEFKLFFVDVGRRPLVSFGGGIDVDERRQIGDGAGGCLTVSFSDEEAGTAEAWLWRVRAEPLNAAFGGGARRPQ